MRARSKYTPEIPPPVVSERKGMLAITNPRDIPPSVYRDAALPELPTPQRKGILDKWFTLSTHIVPAAFPRSGPDVPYPEGCDADSLIVPEVEGGPAAVRKARTETGVKVRNALYGTTKKHWLGELPGHSEKPFWACVNRFVRKVPVRRDQERGRKRVTLLFAHGNGFGKESWEPVLLHMVSHSRDGDPIIDEIWSWEAVNHGDPAVINRQNLGALYEWMDNSRDVINFLTYYLPDTVGHSGDKLPTHLPLISQEISGGRTKSGLTKRTIVGIGHSFGGCTLALAAAYRPEFFSALVLLDPVIAPLPLEEGMAWADGWGRVKALNALCDGVANRKNGWESKAEALRSFKKNPFFATWDPLSLELYVECQLWENKEAGEVKLKMSGIMEGTVFAGHRGPIEGWDTLPLLDERVALKFIIPEAPLLDLKSARHLPFLRPKNSSHVVIMGTGHLFCHEVPQDTGDEIASFLRKEYGSGWQPKL